MPVKPIQELDQLILEALKQNTKVFRLNRPSLWRRIKGDYEYRVHWSHCDVSTELVKFNRIAKELEGDVMNAAAEQRMVEGRAPEVKSEDTVSRAGRSTSQGGQDRDDDVAQRQSTSAMSVTSGENLALTILRGSDKHHCHGDLGSLDSQSNTSFNSPNEPPTPSLNNRLLDDGCSATSNLGAAGDQSYDPGVTPEGEPDTTSAPLLQEGERSEKENQQPAVQAEASRARIGERLRSILARLRGGRAQPTSATVNTTVKKNAIVIHPHVVEDKEPKAKKIYKELLDRKLCLFKTSYVNTTDMPHKMQFQTEKKTTSSATVSLEKSLTISGGVDLNMKCPVPAIAAVKDIADPLNVLGKVSAEFTATKNRSTHVEEELTWHVNNEITVNPGIRVEAELSVVEEDSMAEFELRHTVTPLRADGIVHVRIVKKEKKGRREGKQRKEKEILGPIEIDNLALIFMKDGKIMDKFQDSGIVNADVAKKQIQFYTKGFIKSVLQVRQNILVQAFNNLTNEPVPVKVQPAPTT